MVMTSVPPAGLIFHIMPLQVHTPLKITGHALHKTGMQPVVTNNTVGKTLPVLIRETGKSQNISVVFNVWTATRN
jgi:hypothetical protein